MKDKMGSYHSSLNCEQFGLSFRGCFGFNQSTARYKAEDDGNVDKNNSPLCNERNYAQKETTSHVFAEDGHQRKKSSRKRSCPRDTCCTKPAEKDDYAYNVCTQSQSHTSQLNSTEKNTATTNSISSMVPSDTSDRPFSSNVESTRIDVCSLKHSSVKLDKTGKLCKNSVAKENTDTKVVLLQNKPSTSFPAEKKDEIFKNREAADSMCTNESKDIQADKSQVIQTKQQYSVDFICSNSSNGKDGPSSRFGIANSCTEFINATIKKECASGTCVPASTLPETNDDGINCFRSLVARETSRLSLSVTKWDSVLQENQCPTEVSDEIRSVIGQTRLVIAERFNQFVKLIDQAEGKSTMALENRPVLNSDLQGFWDMIYFQVEDVSSKFELLKKRKENGWNKTDSTSTASNIGTSSSNAIAKRQPKKVTKKSKGNEEDKKRRDAAKKRLAEARKALAQRNESKQNKRQSSSGQDGKTDLEPNQHQSTSNGSVNVKTESIVDVLSCAVAVGPANSDQTAISPSSLVH
ncbi:uncharacterized protein LOC143468242 [Clavelina lepadiformis]|uniref:uncharacterized protein LOC143468242 n=1 Tax=Clavelina lepadiformis TaxID=159417 RepID=UPI004041B2A5